MTTPLSPPGTKVLALIPNLFGPGLNAEMTYHETPTGARVFFAPASSTSRPSSTRRRG